MNKSETKHEHNTLMEFSAKAARALAERNDPCVRHLFKNKKLNTSTHTIVVGVNGGIELRRK